MNNFKVLHLNGKAIFGEKLMFKNQDVVDVNFLPLHFFFPVCQSVQEIIITDAEYLTGVVAIGKLKNLKILKLIEAKNVSGGDWVNLFDNRNLAKLLQLDLTGCSWINYPNLYNKRSDQVIRTIALNCPLLEDLSLDNIWDEGKH